MKAQSSIEQKIQAAFNVTHMELHNESHMHNVPENSQTHFKLVVVSESFAGKTAVARHQTVYALLNDELSSGVHALALHLYTPQEWSVTQEAPVSPACLGGSGK